MFKRSVGSAMVWVAWGVVTKSDHVAAPLGVRSQYVVDLVAGKIAITTANILDGVGIDEGEESGGGCIAQ